MLLLPFSTNSGQSPGFINALFTATSAVCVAGLVIADTATYWSPFGQAVILALIQIGGLGFMAGATIVLLLIGRRITLKDRLLLREALGSSGIGGLVRFTQGIALMVLAIEAVGAILLLIRFASRYPVGSAIWQAVFHAISGFNNAGFSILPESQGFIPYQEDYYVIIVVSILMVLGATGYAVLANVARVRRFTRLALDTKIVIVASVSLLVLGTFLIMLMEFTNPNTLGPLPIQYKLLNSFFLSAASRTTGFSTIPIGSLTEYTLFFIMALMFIGGAAGSMSGGIKVNTFGVLTAAIVASIRGREHAEAFGREISESQIHKALTLAALAIGIIFTSVMILTFTEGAQFIATFFESVSAFSIVGHSTGITPTLSVWGKVTITITMFLGRVGPLTLAYSLTQRMERSLYRYAEERVKIG